MRRWKDGLPPYCDFAASLVDRANTRDNAWVVVFTLLDSMPPGTTHVPPQYHSTTTLNCSGQQPFLKKQHSAQCQPHIVLQHKEHKKISRIAVCKLSSLTSDLWIFGPFCTCASGSVGWSVGCLVVFFNRSVTVLTPIIACSTDSTVLTKLKGIVWLVGGKRQENNVFTFNATRFWATTRIHNCVQRCSQLFLVKKTCTAPILSIVLRQKCAARYKF